MTDAAYFRAWRAAHPEYRKRQTALRAERRRIHGREDRTTELANRRSRAIDTTPLPPLFPALHRGGAIAFWDEELRMDLMQEAVLAELEGRDPQEACRSYRAREGSWFRHTAALMENVA